MNRSFKVVWNASRQVWMVVGELTKAKGKSKSSSSAAGTLSRRISTVLLGTGLAFSAVPAWATDTTWIGTTGDWFSTANWDTGNLPIFANDVALIDNGGTAQVGSSTASAATLIVGNTNTGSLAISTGGVVNDAYDGVIGGQTGSNGTVTVDGGSWTNGNNIFVGYNGSGSLTVRNGGTVAAGGAHISYNPNSTGTLNIGAAQGQTAVAAGNLDVPAVYFGTIATGTGKLVFNHTNTNYTFSPDINGAGSVELYSGTTIFTGANTYSGGTTINGGTLYIGDGTTTGSISGDITNNSALIFNRNDALTYAGVVSGAGSLGQSGAGTLTLTGTNTYTGGTSINAGTLQIGNGSTTGSISGDITNNAALAFNHSDDVTYSNVISGTGSLTQAGAGTLTLTNANTYSGATTINGGTLKANNTTGSATGTGTVTVNSGATLGGSGTISGTVTVGDGATLAAGNSPGTLTVGALTLDNSSNLGFELNAPSGTAGTDSDLIAVNGNLTLDGILNITDLGGFDFGVNSGDSGSYQLFSYSGALTDNTVSFGSGVLAGYNYTIDTATGGKIFLTADYNGLQFWDGSNTSANSSVDGGNGTWDASTTNWTAQNGDTNLAWNNLTAVFQGTAGTVEVDGTQTIAGLQFATDGYQLTDNDSNGALSLAASGAEMRVDTVVAATVGVAITGTGSLTKTGDGSLVLTAANTYTGGTSINAGILQIGDGGTTGSIGGDITDNGALVFNRSDSLTVAGNISGTGSVSLNSGTTLFTGDLSGHTGTMTVSGGTLSIADGETLSLGGNYAQTADGILKTGASSNTSYGKLTVTGTATFSTDTTIDVDVTEINTLAHREVLTGVVSAGNLDASTFTLTDNSALFDFNAVINGNNIDLEVFDPNAAGVTESVTSTGFTTGLGAAKVLDTIVSGDTVISADMDEVVTALGKLETQQQVSDAVAESLPLLVSGTTQIATNTLHATNRVIQARQSWFSGLSSGNDFLGDRHMWLKPIGSRIEQDNRNGVSGYKADSYGFIGGLDGDLNNTTKLGLAISYMNSDVDGKDTSSGNSADIDAYQAIVYGSRSFASHPDVELNWQTDIGINKNQGRRNISFMDRVAKADYDSYTAHVGTGAGKRFQLSDATTLIPSIRADYAYIKDESYTETGAGALNLDVDSNHSDELIVMAQGNLGHQLNDKATIKTNLGLGYDLLNDATSLTASYTGGGTAFTTQGIDPSPWLARAGIGMNFQTGDTSEITAQYDIEGRQDFLSQTASIRFRWAF